MCIGLGAATSSSSLPPLSDDVMTIMTQLVELSSSPWYRPMTSGMFTSRIQDVCAERNIQLKGEMDRVVGAIHGMYIKHKG